jgi:dihydrofolate reductase
MGKLIFGMMQSLDGYVAGVVGGPELPPPGVALHRYFNDHVRGLAGSLYGRRMYEVMRYWDEDRPEWGAVEHDFAAAWRAQPKWVASRSLKSVGANATLVSDKVEAFVRRLKLDVEGDIDVAGPELAGSLNGCAAGRYGCRKGLPIRLKSMLSMPLRPATPALLGQRRLDNAIMFSAKELE